MANLQKAVRLMELPILLIIIGIVVAVLVHWGLGVLLVIVGVVLLVLPYIRSRGGASTRQ